MRCELQILGRVLFIEHYSSFVFDLEPSANLAIALSIALIMRVRFPPGTFCKLRECRITRVHGSRLDFD